MQTYCCSVSVVWPGGTMEVNRMETYNRQDFELICKCGNKITFDVDFQHGFIDVSTYRITCPCGEVEVLNTKDAVYHVDGGEYEFVESF